MTGPMRRHASILAAYFAAEIPADRWNELKALNLIDPEVPTP